MWPHLGQVERVVGHLLRIGFGHHLHVQCPLREIAARDRVEQVTLVAFAVLANQRLGLGVTEILDALPGAEMELHPVALTGGVPEAVGVRTEAMHVAVAGGNAAITHHDGHLVQRLGQQCPVVPVVGGAAQIGVRAAFHCLVEVRELERVANEEHGRVVAHHVPIAFLGIELQGKAANVALGVGRATFACHGSEAREHFGLLADLGKEGGARVLGDVVGNGEGAKRAGTLGMHASLGDYFAHEVGKFLVQPDILGQQGPTRPGREAVLVVRHRGAEIRGQMAGREIFRLAHGVLRLAGCAGIVDRTCR